MKKSISVIAVILSVMIMLTSCTVGGKKEDGEVIPSPDPELVKNTINATIELESGDEIVLELYPDLAPETVANFVELAEDGFYDGTIFHRVIEDFVIQGGGYDENLKEQKADTIEGEFAANGFENSLAHARGVISMARAQNVNSATSQFFIVVQNSTFLDGQYAAFGRVIEGMDVVDEIASERTGSVASMGMEDVPVDPIVIETITIDSDNTVTNSKKSSSKKSKDKDDDDDEDDDENSTSSRMSFGDDGSSSKSSNSSTKSSDSSKSSKSTDDDEELDDDLMDAIENFRSMNGGDL